MDYQTPNDLSVSISPDNISSSPQQQNQLTSHQSSPPKAVCPFSGAVASSSSSCPFASSSSSPPPAPTNTDSQKTVSTTPASQGTCPFATVIPSSRRPILQTLPDGTVVEVARRCPKWVRVLRFSAKFIAKQVVMRTAKKVLITLFNNLRDKHQKEEKEEQVSVDKKNE